MGETSHLRSRFVFTILISFCNFRVGQSVWLILQRRGTRCVSEQLHNNIIVLGEYVVVSDDHFHPSPLISIKVSSPSGKTIHHEENVTHGQFSFWTSEDGKYVTCVWADVQHVSGNLSVNVEWKTGISTRDWETVARKGNVDGIEIELKKLEGAIEAIRENHKYMESKELEMLSASEITNSKVASYTIMSFAVCIVASLLQTLYLKQYFQRVKLI